MYNTKCLFTKTKDYWLWHRRLGHVNFDLTNNIAFKTSVVGRPKTKFLKMNIVILTKWERK